MPSTRQKMRRHKPQAELPVMATWAPAWPVAAAAQALFRRQRPPLLASLLPPAAMHASQKLHALPLCASFATVSPRDVDEYRCKMKSGSGTRLSARSSVPPDC